MIPDWLLRTALAGGILAAGWALFCLLRAARVEGVKTKGRQIEGLRPGVAAVVYFTTPDCATCKAFQRPALARLERLAKSPLQVLEINAYEKPELAKEWGVLSVPTTFILDAGGVPRQVNFGAASAEKLLAQLANI